MKFHKVLFSSVLFNLMFKIVQRIATGNSSVVHSQGKQIQREREHESRDGVRRSRHVDSYSYFPIVWSRSKGGGKKVIKGLKSGERKVDTSKPLFEADSYILQVIKDSMQRFQAEIEFPVHVDLLVKRRHSVGMVWGQRLCQSL